MVAEKCEECKTPISLFFAMKKDEEIKEKICLSCKKKLRKEGWAVICTGTH